MAQAGGPPAQVDQPAPGLKWLGFALNHLYGSLFSAAGTGLRLILTVGLLVSVHPVRSVSAGGPPANRTDE